MSQRNVTGNRNLFTRWPIRKNLYGFIRIGFYSVWGEIRKLRHFTNNRMFMCDLHRTNVNEKGSLIMNFSNNSIILIYKLSC